MAEDKDYIVRLVMRVEADDTDPAQAALKFVDLMVENGLRDWVYRVEDNSTGDIMGYYDGWGNVVDINSPVEVTEPPVEDVPLPSDPPEANPAEVESDAELLALAESLNEGTPASGQ